MALIGAYTLPHPPLAVPGVGRGQEKGINSTMAAFDEVALEIAGLAPETIVYVTPHNVLYADYFHISPGNSARGDFARFSAPEIKLETRYDTEFVDEISRLAKQNGISAGTLGEKDKGLDHGVTVPMWFINNRYSDYKSLRISQSGMDPSEHYSLGRLIAEAANALGRKTILIASSDLSHKLKSDGPYGLAPEGPQFDKTIAKVLAEGDFLSLFEIPDDLRERAAECGYNSLMVLAGCFDRRDVSARLLSYEGPFGVGYAIASFMPGEPNERRDVMAQFKELALAEARERKEAEDDYRSLARLSLEHKVRSGGDLPLPGGIPDELLKKKAGVFVSLHKNGRLRGCVGTIAPTTASIANEIVQNAVSAGLNDNRFERVSEAELPFLTYKVDVLSAPEPISGPEQLDVKRYGVIVSSGYKRGLLLPNLDGIDTVEEQISIARRKAGISEREKITLERFEVVRHE